MSETVIDIVKLAEEMGLEPELPPGSITISGDFIPKHVAKQWKKLAEYQFNAKCPFCKNQQWSLILSVKRQDYVCVDCNAAGDVADLLSSRVTK